MLSANLLHVTGFEAVFLRKPYLKVYDELLDQGDVPLIFNHKFCVSCIVLH